MNIQNEIYRRLKMHELLLHSNTGTPEELAQKLHVSKRQLYNLVDEFRAMGASIKYSRESKTYYYTNDKKCHFSAKESTYKKYLREE